MPVPFGGIHACLSSLQIKKQQQDVVRFLEANKVEFEEVDITMSEEQRQWMYKNIPPEKRPAQGNPLPPQIFNGDRYCGVSSGSSPRLSGELPARLTPLLGERSCARELTAF